VNLSANKTDRLNTNLVRDAMSKTVRSINGCKTKWPT